MPGFKGKNDNIFSQTLFNLPQNTQQQYKNIRFPRPTSNRFVENFGSKWQCLDARIDVDETERRTARDYIVRYGASPLMHTVTVDSSFSLYRNRRKIR